MANASIIVFCMQSSHDPAMNRSPCRCFSLRAGIGITSHSAHLRAPIGSHIQNVSVDPIQLSAGLSVRKSVLNTMRFSRMAIKDCVPSWDNFRQSMRPDSGQIKVATDACLVDWTGHLRLKNLLHVTCGSKTYEIKTHSCR